MRCNLYRNPADHNARRTYSSGRVSRPFTLDIIAERVRGVKISAKVARGQNSVWTRPQPKIPRNLKKPIRDADHREDMTNANYVWKKLDRDVGFRTPGWNRVDESLHSLRCEIGRLSIVTDILTNRKRWTSRNICTRMAETFTSTFTMTPLRLGIPLWSKR